MAKQIVEIVSCDRCGKKMEGPSRHREDGSTVAKLSISVSRVVDGKPTSVSACEYVDMCESCDTYTKKQLDYILLTRKRGRPRKGSSADAKPKRPRKARAVPPVSAAPLAGLNPFPQAPVEAQAPDPIWPADPTPAAD